MVSIETKVLKVIPRRYEDARNTLHILHKVQAEFNTRTVAYSHIKAAIKFLRKQGYPILWNHHGIYLSYDRRLVEKQMETIDHMKNSYFKGMSQIQNDLKTKCIV